MCLWITVEDCLKMPQGTTSTAWDDRAQAGLMYIWV